MASCISTLLLLFVALVALTLAVPVPNDSIDSISVGPCNPKKCRLPDCRCWNDRDLPGGVSPFMAPQMVLLTFDFAFNQDIVKKYEYLFDGLFNPNGCPAKGTFFVQSYNSDTPTLKMLHEQKHELAINSHKGIIPFTEKEWEDNINAVEDLLKEAHVPLKEIKGIRAPQLFSGGNEEFEAMQKAKLQYDASCVNVKHSDLNNLLWPYTLDNVDNTPPCSIGKTVSKTFPGVWSFPVPVLDYKGMQCPVPSGCLPEVNATKDVFDLFFAAFNGHYNSNRAPLVIDIDPQWVTDRTRLEGTKQFLELLMLYPDSWILTMDQALQWIKHPQEVGTGANYLPWSC